MISRTIFVVDDNESIRSGLTYILKSKYRVRSFPDAEEALEAIKGSPPDLVLLDLGLPGMNGIDALREMKAVSTNIQVVVITAYDDVKSVVSAMKNGAHDYIVKPLQPDTVEVSIRNALEAVRLKMEVQSLQESCLRENLPGFIGKSDKFQDVIELVATLAKSPDTPILILGETGTGKELIASSIHYRSPNFKGPFVSVNCAAIPKGLIESELFGYEKGAFSGASATGKKGLVEHAVGGTLFLDEVGDLSLEAQAKLLRFLEEGEFYRVGGVRKHHVRTRVVSATNKDLGAMIEKGLFREDLYYRLAVAKVAIPSLNDRPDDIILMARHFLQEFNRRFDKSFTGISPEAEAALKAHRWKGNVRELKNLIERGTLIGKDKVLSVRDLGLDVTAKRKEERSSPGEPMYPDIPPEGIDLSSLQEAMEKHYIGKALQWADGNESQAARLLNMNHHTFRYRRRKLDV